jgi:NDP-sugar pyrophosphorylase family protein
MINLHHLPETIRTAIDADHPAEVKIHFSEEPRPLGTGGGIRRAADFLRESEACVVLAGDMLLDVPLRELFERHLASGRHATLLLRRDSRDEDFGTIGVDASGNMKRIGQQQVGGPSSRKLADDGVETSRGLFTGVRFFSREVLDNWPRGTLEDVFEDLRDWLIPGVEIRGESVGAEIVESTSSVWEPVGTPAEYLRVNLCPPDLPTLGGSAAHWGGEIEVTGENEDVIVSRKAFVPADALLERCVVWDGERVPSGFQARDGIYAGGAFRSCLEETTEKSTEKVH